MSACKVDLDQVSIKKEGERDRASTTLLGYDYGAAFLWLFVKYGVQEERVWLELT